MDYQLHNTLCTHVHAVVQLCGIETVESHSPQEDTVDCTEQQSVSVFKEEPADSPRDCQSEDSSPIAAEINMLLEADCVSANDSKRHYNEIDDLMNTIRGSLVGGLNSNLFDFAMERFQALADQINAAAASGSSRLSSNPAE